MSFAYVFLMHVLKLIVPEVGMTFKSESKAYVMYNTYAGKVGFNIRKSTSDGTISQKYIVCSSEGHQQNESSSGMTRTRCKAHVQFSVSKAGIWTTQKIELHHNHYLASPRAKN
jgi:zinc finger SWIM domain-containing protein 3